MKIFKLLNILLIASGVFMSCQKEVVESATIPTTKHSNLRYIADYNCVDNYEDTKITYDYERGVHIDVWNDGTNVYTYKTAHSGNNTNNASMRNCEHDL